MSVFLDMASVEVRDPGPATDLLYPDVLDAVGDRIQIGLRDDHLSRKRFVVAIPLPVEVREQHDGLVTGLCSFEGFAGSASALESRGGEQRDRVPPHSLSGK